MRDLDCWSTQSIGARLKKSFSGWAFYQRSVNSQAFYAAHYHSMPFYPVRGMDGLKFIVAVSVDVEIRSYASMQP
jgi:hypothetical protein